MPRKGARRETQKEKKKRLEELTAGIRSSSSQLTTNYGAGNIDKNLAEKLDEEIGENWKLVEDSKTVRIKITINEHGEEVFTTVNEHGEEVNKVENVKENVKASETELKSKAIKPIEQTITASETENSDNNEKNKRSSPETKKYDASDLIVDKSEDKNHLKDLCKEDHINVHEEKSDNFPNNLEQNEGGEKDYEAIYNEKTNSLDVYFDENTLEAEENSCLEVNKEIDNSLDDPEKTFDQVLDFWGGQRKYFEVDNENPSNLIPMIHKLKHLQKGESTQTEEEAAEVIKKAEEESADKKKAEEEADTKRKAEEESAGKKKAEEEADADAKRKAEEESAGKKKAEEGAAAERKAEEDAATAAKKAEDEAAAKKKAEEEIAAKRKAEEGEAAAAKKEEEEAAAEKKAEEEEIAKKKAEEKEAAKKKAKKEAASIKKAAKEAAAKKKAEEEAASKKKAEEEAAAKKKAKEEADAKKKAEEEAVAKKKAEEEAASKTKAEEEAVAKKKAEEEAASKKKAEEETAAAAKKAEEKAVAKKKAEEEAAATAKKVEEEAASKKKAEEEADINRKAEEEAAAKKKAEEEAAAKKKAEEEAAATAKKAEEEAAANNKAEEEASAAAEKADEETFAAAKKAEEEAAAAVKKAGEEAAVEKMAEDEEGEESIQTYLRSRILHNYEYKQESKVTSLIDNVNENHENFNENSKISEGIIFEDNNNKNTKTASSVNIVKNEFIANSDLSANGDEWFVENLSSYLKTQLDDELGFGILSEIEEEEASVMVLLKESSPFIYNNKGALHFSLPSIYFYSLPYHVVRTNSIENSSRTVFMLRHFLHLPSLSSQQINNLQVVACKQSNMEEFFFIKPIHIDPQYIYIEHHDCNWFQVISNFEHLPISAVLVPFRMAYSIDTNIFICPLPSGHHHIQKMLHENPGWKKCGYEEPCVLNKGTAYQLFCEDGKEREWCGKVKTGVSIREMQWVRYGEEKWRNQAYVKVTLEEEKNKINSQQVVFSGELSLYHYLTLEQDYDA